jgi:hypothetical protein
MKLSFFVAVNDVLDISYFYDGACLKKERGGRGEPPLHDFGFVHVQTYTGQSTSSVYSFAPRLSAYFTKL